MPIPETMQPIASTNITAIGYDADNLTMYIQFLDSSAYAYKGVQEHEFENLKTAPSVRFSFNRNNKNVYPYEQV